MTNVRETINFIFTLMIWYKYRDDISMLLSSFRLSLSSQVLYQAPLHSFFTSFLHLNMTKVNMTKKNKRSAIPRPLNSFMIFRLEHQASVSKETPGAKHQDISKKLSARWKALNPEEKQEYKAKALAAKEKHKLL